MNKTSKCLLLYQRSIGDDGDEDVDLDSIENALKRFSRESEGNFEAAICIFWHWINWSFCRLWKGELRVTTPTAIESQLPWKRDECDTDGGVQQNEFPAWASNKEYLAYNSPSATFLGKVFITISSTSYNWKRNK